MCSIQNLKMYITWSDVKFGVCHLQVIHRNCVPAKPSVHKLEMLSNLR